MMFKKLNKVLSLIMALSMMMSVFTVNVSAEATQQTLLRSYALSCKNSGSKPFTNETSSTSYNTANNVVAYYVFENIEYASAMTELSFTAKTTSAQYCPREMHVYITYEKPPVNATTAEWKTYIGGIIGGNGGTLPGTVTPDKTFTNTYDTTTATVSGDIAYDNTTKYYTLDLSDIGAMNDGATIIVGIDRLTVSGNKGPRSYYDTGELCFSMDTDEFNKKVLASVNAATDKTAMASLLEAYKSTIGIADIIANIADDSETQKAIAEKILANITSESSYSDFSTIAADYQTAYDEVLPVMALKRVNEAADAASLSDVLKKYTDIIGIGEMLTKVGDLETKTNEKFLANRPETGYVSFNEVNAAYAAAYDEAYAGLIAEISNASTAEEIEALITTHYETIGIKISFYESAKTAIDTALLASDFETMEEVVEAYNAAYYSVMTVKSQLRDYVLECYNSGSGKPVRIPEDSEIVLNAFVAYFVFADLENAANIKNLSFTATAQNGEFPIKALVYSTNISPEEAAASDTWKDYFNQTVVGSSGDTGTLPGGIAPLKTLTAANGDIAITTGTTYKVEIGDLELNDGDTLIVAIPRQAYRTYSHNATLHYDINEAEYNEKVISYINSAADASAMADYLKTYQETIGIADIMTNVSDNETEQLLLASKIYEKVSSGTEYSSYEEIAADYQAAYDSAEMLLGDITLTDSDDGTTVYESITAAAGKNVNISISAAFVDEESYFSLLGIYGADNLLLQAQTKAVTASETSIVFEAVAIPESVSAVKIMAWKSLKTMIPLCSEAVLSSDLV